MNKHQQQPQIDLISPQAPVYRLIIIERRGWIPLHTVDRPPRDISDDIVKVVAIETLSGPLQAIAQDLNWVFTENDIDQWAIVERMELPPVGSNGSGGVLGSESERS